LQNIQRDEVVNEKLKDEGWTILRFWGREIQKELDKCIAIVERSLM
jgi:DNA mismatch endonuclease (patch repair protein)